MSYKKYDTFFVYKHTNLVNFKVYIGITKQDPRQRWRKGEGYKGSYFYKAIQKYGWDNFEHEILFEGLTKEEACLKEIELIKMYNSTNRKQGYNITKGGEINFFEHKKGKDAYWFNKHHSEETKKKISKNNARWLLGKKRDRKLVEKIRLSIINSPNREHLKKKVLCIENNIVYDSIQQASKILFGNNNCRHGIKEACEGKYKQCKGYHFEYI